MATEVATEIAHRNWRLKLPERLPALKGHWLTIYSYCWIAALTVALIGAVGGAASRMSLGAGETYTWGPLGMYLGDKDGRVRNVAGRDIEATGVHVGDAILSANGVPVPADVGSASDESIALDRELQRLPEGSTVQLTVRASDGKTRQVRLPKRSTNAERLYADTGLTPGSVTLLSGLAFLLAPLIFSAAACMLFSRRRDPVAALLSLSFVLIACGWGNIFWSQLIGAAADKVASNVVGALGGMGLVLVLLTFPQGKFEPKWTALMALSLPFLEIASVAAPYSELLEWVGRAIIAAALLSMVLRYRRTAPEDRQQWRWALFGFVAGMGFLISWNAAYGAYLKGHSGLSVDLWSWMLTPTMMTFFILLIVGGVTLSVLRYRLYDTSAAVSRSAAYGVLTLGFVALFAGTEKLAEIVGERYFEHSIGIGAGAVGAAVAAAVIVPLHNRVHRWAERRFQKPLIRLRDGLPELVADLRESASVDQLVAAVIRRVETGVRSTREAVLLEIDDKLVLAGSRGVSPSSVEEWQSGWPTPNGEHSLDCDKRDALFPLRVRLCIESSDEPETIGWLLLGPRPDGSFFGKDEREALAEIAGPVARAIHIAQLREQRESQAEKRIGALEGLIAKLTESLRNPGQTGTASA